MAKYRSTNPVLTRGYVGYYNFCMIKDLTFDKSTITSLKKIVGSNNIITDKEGVYAYTFD